MTYKVLIIDDEPWSRQVVISLLEWERLNLTLVGEAEDGEMGLELIAELKPHIVITDMRMPGLSGSEFLVMLEEKFPWIKIVVLSGYDDFSYLQQALRSGAIDYLLKPLDPEDLNKTLEKCIAELAKSENKQVKSSSIIFSDSEVLNEYVQHRKRVFSKLLELDSIAVKDSLNKLHAYLENVSEISSDIELGKRIIHDFTLILEEFITRFELDSSVLENLNLRPENLSAEQIFPSIENSYDDTIKLIKEFQIQKGFLNLSEVKEHIDRYYQEQLSLDTVSKLFLVSKEHMSRAFKKTYKITINDYITSLRMEKARELIVDEKVEIKLVAFLCGYTDLAYFYRVFKKHFGIPPGQMRV